MLSPTENETTVNLTTPTTAGNSPTGSSSDVAASTKHFGEEKRSKKPIPDFRVNIGNGKTVSLFDPRVGKIGQERSPGASELYDEAQPKRY